ncbi:MAG: hypothetical protein ACI8YI_001939 [Paracoccaceae bacterium]|jgi:hypothetical protein
MKLRLGFLLAGLVFPTSCAVQLPWAPDERVQRAVYHAGAPYSITLMTVVANDGKGSGHSSLLINGSQRVIYDPAGTWFHKDVPERADMLYGMTPTMLQYYIDYHARARFHVVMQTKVVSRQTADKMIALAVENGASANGFCAQNTSHLISLTQGFEGFPVGLWPKDAVAGMNAVPGVTAKKIFQDDEGKDLKS